jgi:phosphate transport system substrate-binding protein
MRITAAVVMLLLLAGCTGTPEPAASGESIACASGSLAGQGSTAQANAVNAWIREYQVSCAGATISYGSVGSGAGITAFLAGNGDFAGSDSPLSATDQPKANARCKNGAAIHLPMVVGPIALAYNVAGVGDLRLRPATIAKIFAGAVSTWDADAIKADNPGAVLPSTPITTIHRKDSSGTTDNFTKFLGATAGADWPFGHQGLWSAPGGQAQQGSDGIAMAVAATNGAIGYVEWSYARFHNLRTARVGNGAGEFVALSDDAAGRTVASASTGPGTDLQLAIDYGTRAPGAYPIVLLTYEIVCEKVTTTLLKSFLSYTSSTTGQATAVRLGYAPLPESVRTRVATVVAGLSD